jgi:hypothetical protein
MIVYEKFQYPKNGGVRKANTLPSITPVFPVVFIDQCQFQNCPRDSQERLVSKYVCHSKRFMIEIFWKKLQHFKQSLLRSIFDLTRYTRGAFEE